MKKLSLIAALLLAGCGSDNSNAPAAEQTPPAPSPDQSIDAFVTAVSGAMVTPDQSEPVKVDALAATPPDNSDPSSLK